MLKQSQRSRPVSREHANHFLSIVRHTNAEKKYHQCGQLTHFHCTIVRKDPPHLAGSHMSYVSPCDRVKSIEMYPYTRSTWSRTLTVVQHTVFDVQASKRLFYTYNTVVLFNNYYNYYYCLGRVCPYCCSLISVDTYATCHMHALSTL